MTLAAVPPSPPGIGVPAIVAVAVLVGTLVMLAVMRARFRAPGGGRTKPRMFMDNRYPPASRKVVIDRGGVEPTSYPLAVPPVRGAAGERNSRVIPQDIRIQVTVRAVPRPGGSPGPTRASAVPSLPGAAA